MTKDKYTIDISVSFKKGSNTVPWLGANYLNGLQGEDTL